MNVLLTGGAGDLGQVLLPQLVKRGHNPRVFDIEINTSPGTNYFCGSLLVAQDILSALEGIDVVIHIAAWHGIHEARGWKTRQEFWDLNVNGTHNLLQAMIDQGVTRLVHISSSSVTKLSGTYGFTKRLAEQAVTHFQGQHNLRAVILRPRAFIPAWNRQVYSDIYQWAQRFWPGAVHIHDVAQAVIQSLDYTSIISSSDTVCLNIDRVPGFSAAVLEHWDENGPGSSFSTAYPQFVNAAQKAGIDTAIRPYSLDISEARARMGYDPKYGISEFFEELQEHGLVD
jgi:nucleoside-diphosphate-sugar epimerase